MTILTYRKTSDSSQGVLGSKPIGRSVGSAPGEGFGPRSQVYPYAPRLVGGAERQQVVAHESEGGIDGGPGRRCRRRGAARSVACVVCIMTPSEQGYVNCTVKDSQTLFERQLHVQRQWQTDLELRGEVGTYDQPKAARPIRMHAAHEAVAWHGQIAPVLLGAERPAVGVVNVDPTAPPYGLLVIGLPSAESGAAGATASEPGVAVMAEDLPVKPAPKPPPRPP